MNGKNYHDDLFGRKKYSYSKKNNNIKGFTLVELLAVITITAIVTTAAVPSTMGISKKLKTNLYCEKIELIQTAAELYGEKNRDNFTTDIAIDDKTYLGKKIQVKDLITTNYLKKDQTDYPYILDPRDKTSDSLYNLELFIYKKNNRIHIAFDNTVNESCNIEENSIDFSKYETENEERNRDAIYRAPTARILIYTGSAQNLIIEGQSDTGTIYYKLGDGEYQTSVPQATNAGPYTVYYKVVSDTYNYNDLEEQSISVKIAKANAKYTAPTSKNLTYNGSAQALINAGSSSTGTMYYKVGDSGTYSTEIPTATNAGTYTVYYKVISTDLNYSDLSEQSISVTINKTSATYTAPTAKSLTYTGSAQSLLNAGSSSVGTMYYRLSTSNSWSTSVPTATNAGTYTVVYKVVSTNSNYSNSSEQSISVTINKASATYSKPTAKSLTYTGSAQSLLNAGSSSVGTMYYRLGTSGSWSTSVPTSTNAGTYTVYYKVTSTNSNYSDSSEQSLSVTINKASAQYTAPTAKSPTYTGSAQALINAGSSTTGTMYYRLGTSGSWSTSVPTATNAGTYTVYYKVTSSNSNYNDLSEKSISVTINKASAAYTAPTAKSPTYTGSAQALINAGSSSTGTMYYRLGASGSWSTSVPTATNAGTYTVYYKVTSTNSNYSDSSEKSLSVTINKASAKYTAPTAKSPTYTGSSQALIYSGSSTTGTMYYRLSTSSSWSTSVPTAINAGTYTVVYKVVSTNSNYSNSSEQSISVTINKASATYTAPTGKTLTYTGSAQALINAGSSSTGTMYYKVGDSGTYSTEIPTATSAGTYTIYYRVIGDSNHNNSGEGSVSATIKDATVTLSECKISVMSAGNSDTTDAKKSLECTNGTTAHIKTDYIACDSTLTTYSTVGVKFKLAAGTYGIKMGAFGRGTYFFINGTKYNATGTDENSNDYLQTTITVTDASNYVELWMQNPGGGYVRMNAYIWRAS